MKHRWSNFVERIAEAEDGNANTRRTCLRCRMVMITVHPPEGWPWTEYVLPLSGDQVRADKRPACRPPPEDDDEPRTRRDEGLGETAAARAPEEGEAD